MMIWVNTNKSLADLLKGIGKSVDWFVEKHLSADSMQFSPEAVNEFLHHSNVEYSLGFKHVRVTHPKVKEMTFAVANPAGTKALLQGSMISGALNLDVWFIGACVQGISMLPALTTDPVNEALTDAMAELEPISPKAKKAATKKAATKKAPSGVVKLSEATDLHQRVHGTDGSSRYVVVAIGPNLNLAARYLGTKLSLRAESRVGAFSLDDQALLKDAQMVVSGGGTHASLHLGNLSEVQAKRVIGATIIGLGHDWEVTCPDFTEVVKGGA